MKWWEFLQKAYILTLKEDIEEQKSRKSPLSKGAFQTRKESPWKR